MGSVSPGPHLPPFPSPALNGAVNEWTEAHLDLWLPWCHFTATTILGGQNRRTHFTDVTVEDQLRTHEVWWLVPCHPAGGTGAAGHLSCYIPMPVHLMCLTLCDPMDYIVHGIFQARILEWVAFPFSRGSSQPRDRTQVSRIAGGFFASWATREALLWIGPVYCFLVPEPCPILLQPHGLYPARLLCP